MRKPRRQLADYAYTGRLTTQQTNEDRGCGCDKQRRRDAGRQIAQRQHCQEAEKAGQYGGGRGVRQTLQREPEFGEKIAGGAGDAQQVRHLADDRDAHEPLDEPAHHRRRDEGGHPAHAQHAEEQEEEADQNCESGGEHVEFGGSLHRDSGHGQSGD